jgi:hypothetical protein
MESKGSSEDPGKVAIAFADEPSGARGTEAELPAPCARKMSETSGRLSGHEPSFVVWRR